jgi:hypothetical protein
MDINHPIKRVEVSALHDDYKRIREFADTLTGQPYWSTCDLLVENGYELEFDVIEDNSDGEFMVNYVLKGKQDVRLGTITLFVGVKNEKLL